MALDRIQPSNNLNISKPTRIQIAIWGALVLVAIFVSLGNYNAYQFGTHFDDSRYAVLARSLVFSDKYGMINVPGEPQPGKYPFGYPLLLVPFILFAPDNFDALKVLSLISTILNASILFFGWRFFVKTRSHWWGIAVTGLYLLAPMTIDQTRRVMSEPIFTTFCLLAVWLTEQAVHGKQGRWWSFCISATLVFALFTRTIGIVLITAIFIYLLFRKGIRFWKEIGLIVVQMILLVSPIVLATPVKPIDLLPLEYLSDDNANILVQPFGSELVETSHSASEYSKPSQPSVSLQQRITDIVIGGITYHFGKDLRAVALPIGGGSQEEALGNQVGIPILPFLSGFLVSGLVILGLFRLYAQEGLSFFLVFAILYFGSLFLWLWNDPRLLYPIQPQIHFGFILGLETVFLWLASTVWHKQSLVEARNLFLVPLVLILMSISLYKSLRIDDSRLHAGDLQVRTSWLKTYSAPSDIIMTEAPETDYLYSGRKTVRYPFFFTTSDQLENYMVNRNIDYILLAPIIEWQPQPVYKPSYSDAAIKIISLLADLRARDKVKLTYSSDRDLIQVYKIVP